jgi:hypothetical protein
MKIISVPPIPQQSKIRHPLHPSWQNTPPPPSTTEHEITMALTDTIQLHHVASHTQGDCCCPFRPSDQHCSRKDPKAATAAPLLPPAAIPTSLFATTQLYPFTVCSPLFFHLFTLFLLLFQIKTNTVKIQKCRPRRQLKQFLPPVSFPNLKRKSQIGPGIQGIATLCLNC